MRTGAIEGEASNPNTEFENNWIKILKQGRDIIDLGKTPSGQGALFSGFLQGRADLRHCQNTKERARKYLESFMALSIPPDSMPLSIDEILYYLQCRGYHDGISGFDTPFFTQRNSSETAMS